MTDYDGKKHAFADLGSIKKGPVLYIMPEVLKAVGRDVRTGKTAPDGDEHPMFQKRRLELPIDEDMVAGIMADGVHTPVVILRDGGDALIVEGKQRQKNAIEANKRLVVKGLEPKPVPFSVFKGSLEEAALRSFQENAQRQDDDPMTVAREVLRLLKMGHKPAAVMTVGKGLTDAVLRQYEHVNAMAREVQDAVEARKVSVAAAVQWYKLSRDEQVAALAVELARGGGHVTVVAAKRARKAIETGAPIEAPPEETETDEESDDDGDKPAAPSDKGDGLELHNPPSKPDIVRLAKYLVSHPSDMGDDFILGVRMAAAAGSLPGVVGLADAMAVFAEQHPKYVKDELTRAVEWAAGKRQARGIAGLTGALKASRQRAKAPAK